MNVSNLAPTTRRGLWGRRITEFIALAIVTCGVMDFCAVILGIRDSVSIVVLTLACVSHPVLRLLRDRRGEAEEAGATRGTIVTAIVAAGPWMLLSWLHAAYPGLSLWQPAAVPAALRYVGCLLAFSVVLTRPILDRESDIDHRCSIPPVALHSLVLMISLLMVSGSLVAVGLTIYWLSATASQRFTRILVVDKSLPTTTDVAVEGTFRALDL